MVSVGGTRRRFRFNRRWMIPAIGAGVVCLVVLVLLLVVYPRVGAKAVREKVIAKLGAKLGREIRIGKVDVRLGHATIHDLEIRGPNDGELPLVHVETIEVEFDTLASFVGKVNLGEATMDGITVTMRRHADGRDNVRDVVTKLSEKKEGGGEGG